MEDKMYSTNMEELLNDGLSKKFANVYLDQIEQERKNPMFDQDYAEWAYSKGFCAESACAYELTEENYQRYLSDYEYYKVWPLNSWEKIWVNDKMTLKYMLANSEFDGFMPRYYYYSTPNGLKSLIDNPYRYTNPGTPTIEEFCNVLKAKGELACKPCNGMMSKGFFKLSYMDEKYYMNNELISIDDICKVVQEHPNYIFTEYLHPCEQLGAINGHIHTLRIVTVNESGNSPTILGGYLRFSKESSGEANYITYEDPTVYNIFCRVDFTTGVFDDAKKIYINRIEDIEEHPDSHAKLSGKIEYFDDLKFLVLNLAKRFSTVEYMGYDIGITDQGFKLMEINTHPGIKYMQIFTPLFDVPFAKRYFMSKIQAIDMLDHKGKKERNDIV